MITKEQLIQCNPDILGGKPIFTGTRVPVKTMFDYLEGGYSLDEFLDQFPTVPRDQAIATLELAKEMLLSQAHSA